MPDIASLQPAIDKIDTQTIPLLMGDLNALVAQIGAQLDRLDGATITVTVKLAPAKEQAQT